MFFFSFEKEYQFWFTPTFRGTRGLKRRAWCKLQKPPNVFANMVCTWLHSTNHITERILCDV